MEVAGGVPRVEMASPPKVLSLRSWRRRRGMTQKAMAATTALSVHTISAIERRVSRTSEPGTMKAISQCLGVGITQIREFAEAFRTEEGGDGPEGAA